jgi:hypothetical protein
MVLAIPSAKRPIVSKSMAAIMATVSKSSLEDEHVGEVLSLDNNMLNKKDLKKKQNWRNQILRLNTTNENCNALRKGKVIFSAQKPIVESEILHHFFFLSYLPSQ